jgi:hypothetical protein
MTPELDNRIYEHYFNHPDVSYVHLHIIHSGPVGEFNLLQSTTVLASQIINDDYTFVLFTRIDIFLKKYLHSIFDLRDKIRMAHLNEISKSHNSFNVGYDEFYHAIGTIQNDVVVDPLVNHNIVYVPRKFFHLIFEYRLYHYCPHDLYRHLSRTLSKDDLDFFLYTSHSSSSDLFWNPIFHQVGRVESKSWPAKHLVFQMPDLKIIHQDPFTDYDNLEAYDFTQNENIDN